MQAVSAAKRRGGRKRCRYSCQGRAATEGSEESLAVNERLVAVDSPRTNLNCTVRTR